MALNPPPALKTLTKNERQEKEQLTAVTHWFHSRGRRDAEGTPIYMKKKKESQTTMFSLRHFLRQQLSAATRRPLKRPLLRRN